MFSEAGRVVAVEPDSLWVEVIQTSACEACKAQKGCGQSALTKVFSARRQHVKALLTEGDTAERYQVDDWVEINVPEDTILQGVALVSVLPLMSLIGGALLGQELFGAAEGKVILTSLAGLAVGMLLVRWISARFAHSSTLYPTIKGPLAAAPAPVLPLKSLD